MDKKDYVIQALTQQRDAAFNETARVVAEANERIDALNRIIEELRNGKMETSSQPLPPG